MRIKQWLREWPPEKGGAKDIDWGHHRKWHQSCTADFWLDEVLCFLSVCLFFDSENPSRPSYFQSVLYSQLLKKVYSTILFNTSIYFFFFQYHSSPPNILYNLFTMFIVQCVCPPTRIKAQESEGLHLFQPLLYHEHPEEYLAHSRYFINIYWKSEQ